MHEGPYVLSSGTENTSWTAYLYCWDNGYSTYMVYILSHHKSNMISWLHEGPYVLSSGTENTSGCAVM